MKILEMVVLVAIMLMGLQMCRSVTDATRAMNAPAIGVRP